MSPSTYPVRYSKPSHSRWGWQVDKPAIQAAVDELGIQRRVFILVQPMDTSTRGTHFFDKDGNHMIRLNAYSTIRSGTEALWHELAHAMQTERHIINNNGAWHTTYERNNENYWNNPYEVEARKIMYEHKEDLLLKRR